MTTPDTAGLPLQALVALGKNWRVRGQRLSTASEMVAVAAGHLMSAGSARMLIISGGRTAGPEYESEAAAMWSYLLRKCRLCRNPAFPVVLEEESFDTAENAANVCTLAADLHLDSIAIVTTRAHLPAAMCLFAAHGLEAARGIAAEDVLSRRSRHYQTLIARVKRSPRHRLMLVAEVGRRALLRVDRRGQALRLLTMRLRG